MTRKKDKKIKKRVINFSNKKRDNYRKAKDTLFLLITIAGFLLLLYPFYTDYQLNRTQKSDIRSYRVATTNKSQEEVVEIEKNNDQLNKQTAEIKEPFATSDFDLKKNQLPEIFGVLMIPKIKLEVPIYPTTSNLVLEKGIGILEGTSLPTGGTGNHSVLTGHRGLSLGKMFTDLPQLKLGDKFYIESLNKTHAYEIDQIETIEPDDLSYFDREEDKDYITLVTCTPLGVNSHRLLVRGHRVPFDAKEKEKEKSYFWTVQNIFLIAFISIFLFVIFLILYHKKRAISRK